MQNMNLMIKSIGDFSSLQYFVPKRNDVRLDWQSRTNRLILLTVNKHNLLLKYFMLILGTYGQVQ